MILFLLIWEGGGNGNPLQDFCLENFMNRGAWWTTVHGVTKRWTQLGGWAHTEAPRSFRLLVSHIYIRQKKKKGGGEVVKCHRGLSLTELRDREWLKQQQKAAWIEQKESLRSFIFCLCSVKGNRKSLHPHPNTRSQYFRNESLCHCPREITPATWVLFENKRL